MQFLTRIGEAVMGAVRQVWSFPKSVMDGMDARKAQGSRADAEAERLDRIRNPNKYLNKVNE